MVTNHTQTITEIRNQPVITIHVLCNDTKAQPVIASLLPALRTLNTTVEYSLYSKTAPRGLFQLKLTPKGQLLVVLGTPVKDPMVYYVTIVGRPVNYNVKNFAGVNLIVKMMIQFI